MNDSETSSRKESKQRIRVKIARLSIYAVVGFAPVSGNSAACQPKN